MVGKVFTECHVQHMNFKNAKKWQFHKGNNATQTKKNSCAVYPGAKTVSANDGLASLKRIYDLF